LLDDNIFVGGPKPLKKPEANLKLLFNHKSKSLEDLSKEMLVRSTNVTAEIIGLCVANFWGFDTPKIWFSGQIMTKWFNFVTKTDGSVFANHSGLTINSRVSSTDFVKFLTRRETRELLPPILKSRKIYGGAKKNISKAKVAIIAKTGTMHFNRGLAGYITKNGVPCAVFAIFSADIERKMSIKRHQLSNPPGSKNWLSQAKNIENTILSNWAKGYI
jgi:D-alanyl-D-alanine carboxypeptidase/D-alanyl-D-alanine-endopeptidase (penicillin-binding protein 4)